MFAFRFETYENVVTKHHLGSGFNLTQSAKWAFLNGQNDSKVTICSVKQIDNDTVEIVKRRDTNLGLMFNYMG